MYGLDMEKATKAVEQIEEAYAADRYMDIDGNVWLGREDERWYMEGDTFWLTNALMHKKMINELMGYEQERRDKAARIEALNAARMEYAIQRYVVVTDTSSIVGVWWETREEVNMGLLNLTSEDVKYTLVRRRKAGPVEVVND